MLIAKYSANGNDFLIFHSFLKKDRSLLAKKLCNRFNGIGADGLIVILPHNKLDFEWEFYNSDGSRALMCGNGSRAAAHYAYSFGLSNKAMRFLTGAGEISAVVEGDVVESELTPYKIIDNKIEDNNKEWFFADTGVPHLVSIVNDLDEFDLSLAKKMRQKYDANVNFILIKNKTIYIRTFERGVEAETLACGTGMVAAFLYANRLGLIKKEAKVYPKSGDEISVRMKDDRLYLKGKVSYVFDTVIKDAF